MREIKLNDVCDVRDGTHDSPKYVTEGYPLVTSKNIVDGKIDISNVNYISREEYEAINKRSKVDDGDILMPMIGTIGKPIIVDKEYDFAIKNVALIKFHNESEVTSKYVRYVLDSNLFKHYIERENRGGTQKFLSLGNIRNFNLPLVSVSEQNEITNILDKTSGLIERKKEQLCLLDDLIKSRFVEMFGDPATNPMEWQETTIGDSCYHVKDGPHVSPKYVEAEEGIPFISARNIVNGMIDFSTAKYVSVDDYNTYIKKCNPQKGDVLYTKGGTTGIAKCIDVDVKFANWVHLALLKFEDDLDGYFFENMLNSDYCYQQSQRLTKGIANRDLVLGSMKQIKFYLPPVELQSNFSLFVKHVDKLKVEVQKSLDDTQILFHSLMQEYFE